MKAILGKKVGMTQIFAEGGEVVPVTVIEAGPSVVHSLKLWKAMVTMLFKSVMRTLRNIE